MKTRNNIYYDSKLEQWFILMFYDVACFRMSVVKEDNIQLWASSLEELISDPIGKYFISIQFML